MFFKSDIQHGLSFTKAFATKIGVNKQKRLKWILFTCRLWVHSHLPQTGDGMYLNCFLVLKTKKMFENIKGPQNNLSTLVSIGLKVLKSKVVGFGTIQTVKIVLSQDLKNLGQLSLKIPQVNDKLR